MRFPIAAALAACALGAAPVSQDDPKSRLKMVRDLAKQGSGAIPNLAEFLADADLLVRIEAVKAIVDIGGQRSLEPLAKAARDNDPEMQIRATDGMVNFYLAGYVNSGLAAQFKRVGNKVVSGGRNPASRDVFAGACVNRQTPITSRTLPSCQ